MKVRHWMGLMLCAAMFASGCANDASDGPDQQTLARGGYLATTTISADGSLTGTLVRIEDSVVMIEMRPVTSGLGERLLMMSQPGVAEDWPLSISPEASTDAALSFANESMFRLWTDHVASEVSYATVPSCYRDCTFNCPNGGTVSGDKDTYGCFPCYQCPPATEN